MSWPLQLQALDETLLRSALSVPAWLTPIFVVASLLGGGWGLLALVPFAVARATRVATLWLLGAIVAQSAAVAILKYSIRRVRPCDALGWCASTAVASPGGFSFPSGHATGSFAFAAFIAVRAPRWAPLAFAWATLVASSRCVLGVHYPSDVVAGALLGGLIGAVVARASLRPRPVARPASVIP